MTEGTMLERLGTGGPIIAILTVLSLVSIALIVAKVIQLWNATSGTALRADALEAWRRGEYEAAHRAMQSGKSPADRVLARTMERRGDGAPEDVLRLEAENRGNAEADTMNRFVRHLELIAMVSPLLGLLGTVLGMITSFQQLELAAGAANASVLAGGIWQALLTTAAGLIVAIPAAVAAGLINARVELAIGGIEGAVGEFLTITKANA